MAVGPEEFEEAMEEDDTTTADSATIPNPQSIVLESPVTSTDFEHALSGCTLPELDSLLKTEKRKTALKKIEKRRQEIVRIIQESQRRLAEVKGKIESVEIPMEGEILPTITTPEELAKAAQRAKDGPMAARDILPIIDFEMIDITDGVSTELPIPEADSTHYLHLLKYRLYDDDGKPFDAYRYIISCFDKDETYRLLRLRDVVTRFGYDQKPCDYWDMVYICDHFCPEAQEDVGVFHLIHSSAMAELGLFSPKVQDMLIEYVDVETVCPRCDNDISVSVPTMFQVAKLLDAEMKQQKISLTAENAALKKQNVWLKTNMQTLVRIGIETGGQMFALMAQIARVLPETDRWKLAEEASIWERIQMWFSAHPDIKTLLYIVGPVTIVLLLFVLMGVI